MRIRAVAALLRSPRSSRRAAAAAAAGSSDSTVRRRNVSVARRHGDDVREQLDSGAERAARHVVRHRTRAPVDREASAITSRRRSRASRRSTCPAAATADSSTCGWMWTTSGGCRRRRRLRGRRTIVEQGDQLHLPADGRRRQPARTARATGPAARSSAFRLHLPSRSLRQQRWVAI